jgi:hypothetical protein
MVAIAADANVVDAASTFTAAAAIVTAAPAAEVAEVVVMVERPSSGAAPIESLRTTHAGSVVTVTADELDRHSASRRRSGSSQSV